MHAAEDPKQKAAQAALAYVPPAGVVGLGTGSTARYFIEEIGRLVAAVPALVVVDGEELHELLRDGRALVDRLAVHERVALRQHRRLGELRAIELRLRIVRDRPAPQTGQAPRSA